MVLRVANSVFDNEEILLLAIRNQEDRAIQHLYKQLYPMTEKYILNNRGTREDAKDLFQDCVIILTEKVFDGLQLTCSISTYFHSMVRNKWLKQLRQTKDTTELKDEFEWDESEDYIDLNNQETQLLTALSGLGENCKKILQMFYWQKLSMLEIANKLNYTNADNAKNQKHKCVTQLKNRIA